MTIEEDHVRRTFRPRRAVAAVAVLSALMLSGCGSPGAHTGSVPVTTDQDKPFVLAGVSGLTQIAQLTGPGAMNDTATVSVAGTDLGSMVNIGDKTFFFFGDTFGERAADAYGGQGENWRSNVVAWTEDADPSDGIDFSGWHTDEFGEAGAMVEGDHDANDGTGEVTKIPTYGFEVDGALYVFYMSVSYWGEPGAWDANHAALARSTDQGRTWTALKAPRWPGDSNFIQVATARVTEGGVDYVYFWAIPAGRFGHVDLMRVPADRRSVEDGDAYTYFAGTEADGSPRWSHAMADAATVLDGTIGELSVMWSPYLERWLMTYSDGGNAYIREGVTPWGPWGDPLTLASAADYPGLYAPFMNPRYVADGGRRIFFSMSLWGPYNVFWFRVDLDKRS